MIRLSFELDVQQLGERKQLLSLLLPPLNTLSAVQDCDTGSLKAGPGPRQHGNPTATYKHINEKQPFNEGRSRLAEGLVRRLRLSGRIAPDPKPS
jgi:hypothetical protein